MICASRFQASCVVIMTIHLAGVGSPASAQDEPIPAYRDPSRPVSERVTDLLVRMSLEEKVAQLLCLWQDKSELIDERGRFDAEKASRRIPDGIGHIARPSDRFGQPNASGLPLRGPRETVELVNAVQRHLVEQTRLGIPALFHEEGLHGYQAQDATHFPQAIALASTWDPELIERIYTVVAQEIRVRGAHLVLSPVVDITRDPRWGRTEETFGEDPVLASELGASALAGFQGDLDPSSSRPLSERRVLATLKHMTGHGQPESGINIGPAAIPERTLRDVFLPPFETGIAEGAAAVMASYNEIDGVPSHVNDRLLVEILREEWGFDGVVVSDYDGITDLVNEHHVAVDTPDAAVQALRAGVDVDLPNGNAYRNLVELVRDGRVDESLVDRSVARVLRLKFLAGLFEDPYADPEEAERITGNAEARALAQEAAERAMILLKNEGDLLPLDLEALERIAVIGPNAAQTVLGGYSREPKQTVSILEGVRAYVGDRAEVLYTEGCRITEGGSWFADSVVLADPEENRRRIAEAVDVAEQADVAVLVVGGNEQTSREAWAANHLGDRTDLRMVGQQHALVEAVVATGTPVVLVLIHGRPLAIPEVVEAVPAILDGWYLGQEEGTAVARVLFGEVNPGGKLPITVPRSVGQLPSFYNAKPSARRGYLFDTTEPLFPFGFGLSYTEFAMEGLTVTPSDDGATLDVAITVNNAGDRAGDEVVQLYLRDEVSAVTRPVLELVDFQRIALPAGAHRQVRFVLKPSDLAYYGRDLQRVVEPGNYEILVGPNSRDLTTARVLWGSDGGFELPR